LAAALNLIGDGVPTAVVPRLIELGARVRHLESQLEPSSDAP
jgi:hypothetical protein